MVPHSAVWFLHYLLHKKKSCFLQACNISCDSAPMPHGWFIHNFIRDILQFQVQTNCHKINMKISSSPSHTINAIMYIAIQWFRNKKKCWYREVFHSNLKQFPAFSKQLEKTFFLWVFFWFCFTFVNFWSLEHVFNKSGSKLEEKKLIFIIWPNPDRTNIPLFRDALDCPSIEI